MKQEEFIKEFNEKHLTEFKDLSEIDFNNFGGTALLNFITHLLEKREVGVSVTDEEIEEEAYDYSSYTLKQLGFKDGAKWALSLSLKSNEAVEFAEWLTMIRVEATGKDMWCVRSKNFPKEWYTTQELHTQYLKEKRR